MATKSSSKGRSPSRSGGSSSRSGKSGKSSSGSSGGSRKGSSSSRGQSSGRSGSKSSSGSGSQRKKLPAAAQKVVGTVKKHPITTAAIGAGVAIAAVAGVRKAMSARAASQQDDVDETEGSEDEEEDEDSEDDDDSDASSEADSGDEDSDDDQSGNEDSEDDSSGRWSTRLSSALSGGASSVGRAARGSMTRGRETARETWENHALALAAGALVAGTAIGLLLPATQEESRLMGKWSDRFAGPAKEFGGQLLGQGKRIVGNVLSEGYNATQEEAEKVGLTPHRLGRKFKRIASHVRDAMAKAVDVDDE